jgi:hypothetical protein
MLGNDRRIIEKAIRAASKVPSLPGASPDRPQLIAGKFRGYLSDSCYGQIVAYEAHQEQQARPATIPKM